MSVNNLNPNYIDYNNETYYIYYPFGDREPMHRNIRIDLAYNSKTNKWRYKGENRYLDQDYLNEISKNVQKKNW